MSVYVESSGLQTTIQAGPRVGRRHQGVPAAGAADLLSLALANRLVGNPSCAPGLEATLTGPLLPASCCCSGRKPLYWSMRTPPLTVILPFDQVSFTNALS